MDAWKVLFIAFLSSLFFNVIVYRTTSLNNAPDISADESSLTSGFSIVTKIGNYISLYWSAIKTAPFPINIVTAILGAIQFIAIGYLSFRLLMAILGRMVL